MPRLLNSRQLVHIHDRRIPAAIAERMIAVVARFVDVEIKVGEVYARICGPSAVQGMEAYAALQRADDQGNLIRSSEGFARLKAPATKAVERAIQLVRDAREERKTVAHGLWGDVEAHPDCVVYVPVKQAFAYYARLHACAQGADPSARLPEYVFPGAKLYKLSDFDAMLSKIDAAMKGLNKAEGAVLDDLLIPRLNQSILGQPMPPVTLPTKPPGAWQMLSSHATEAGEALGRAIDRIVVRPSAGSAGSTISQEDLDELVRARAALDEALERIRAKAAPRA